MSKKGFTLVELLAVIVILGLIMLIASKSIMASRNNSLQKVLNTKIDEVKKAAIIYGQENPSIFESHEKCNGEYSSYQFCVIVTVNELIEKDFFTSVEENSAKEVDLINNVTGESMKNDQVYIYRKNNMIYAHMPKYDD